MTTRLLLTFLSIAFSTTLFAQTGSVKGRIVDGLDKSVIEYASVSAFNAADSTLTAGQVSTADGSFMISKLRAGTYYLRVAFIGYASKMIPGFSISAGETKDLGAITLERGAKSLAEITVSGQQVTSSNKIDKQTYKAAQFESAKGGSAIDVMKNLPSVSVTGQGEINVRGSANFLVLINGKPVLTDAQTALSQLPANSIENIELVTSPSAKYDPDGKGGIINITTRRGATNGFTLAANAMGGLPSTTTYNNAKKPVRFGGDITLNFKQDKWDISAGGNYNRNDNTGYREGEVFTKNFQNNTITRFPSEGERSFVKENYAGRASVIFSPDASNTFSAGFFSGRRHQVRVADILYNNTTSDLTTNNLIRSLRYFNSNHQTKNGNFTLGNFDYTHNFKDKSALNASVLYERARLYGNTTNTNVNFPNTATVIQTVVNPYENPIDGYRFKLDYSIGIGKGKLESGYQFRYDTQDGKFDYFVSPATSQPDANRFRGTAKAKNQINSIYSQYAGKTKKLDYIAGLRYELARRTVRLSYDPNPHILNLSNLFPSANLLYHVNSQLNLKAGYSKRVQRTNNYELNPIPEREHSETLEQGDPDLLPGFIDLAEIGLNKTLKSGSLFATLYYQGIKNPIQRVNSVYADTILNRVFTNAEFARSLGVEAGLNLQPFKWWTLYLGGNLYNYKIRGDLNVLGMTTNVSNNALVHSINTNHTFRLSNTLFVQGNINYLSARPTAQGEDSRFITPNTSVKKSFMNGRFSTTLQWLNMDLGTEKSNRQRITTTGLDFYTTTNYIYETDVFMLNFSFNLNKSAAKAKLPASEFGDKEF
ncbi:TonB-dependent receptor domain-containing protein [Daejeonella lutea]|uniref:Outer membrane receptor proteins, mostly Fe transport n=1 Tax=Daejeonella lutea TaxID=572036 RepID=A0A1T5AXT7_9SPHI|nr:TonB-dependent receptor [Daejeonella lutea]SKB39871.1 Outer membrane receptor proteins, mostly Fe transport [Daejeonella lutea]